VVATCFWISLPGPKWRAEQEGRREGESRTTTVAGDDPVKQQVARQLAAGRTVLGIRDHRFTINGEPTFMLGISYFAALGAPEEFWRLDLDDLQRHGFNWLRVWANCGFFGQRISTVTPGGRQREPFLSKLGRLVAECDRRGLIVDVTLVRAAEKPETGLPDFEAHEHAVKTLVRALATHRNWYLDLANERDVRDERYVPATEVQRLRALVRRLDPARLVTASFGGHDLDLADLRESLITIEVDFICPHRPREQRSPGQTEARTRECLALVRGLGRLRPVLYQEPLRRGYLAWEPAAADLLADLRGARLGGAAGWCFHNGPQRGAPGSQPRRSFDLSARRLFDQLDEEERLFVSQAAD
jgi:hypothetical protein